MEVFGTVFAVLPMQTGTGANGTWKRQTVVIEYMDGQYPNKIAVENSNKADEFAALTVGSKVKIHFSPSSREYNGKWYTSLRCFAWEVTQAAQAAQDDLPV